MLLFFLAFLGVFRCDDLFCHGWIGGWMGGSRFLHEKKKEAWRFSFSVLASFSGWRLLVV